ncbi:hypothetical protein JZO78_04405 [Enterococcus ureilyticus]|uniref:hypothetical protein n=1 Tax=Enterococcus ureilyticus TaxID=1131292 RepID=UPI001A938D24|nr:hypothetical protein [Enterococcus ureilyticus]MBO0445577.1 hypothetical protein [Enterococcus ureilyticus]
MTEKTLKQSQSDMLHTLRAEFRLEKSVETALYNFLVDDEGEVLSNQEFLEVLRAFDNWVVNKDHQPAFAVGEYRAYKDHIYKITEDHETYICCAELVDGVLISHSGSYKSGGFYHGSSPATAEQIATFKRAEHFASKGRKLDEFRVGDKIVIDGIDEIVKIESLRGSAISGTSDLGNSYSISLLGTPVITLIQTAEELQEVENNE